jgi:hypothetical protein
MSQKIELIFQILPDFNTNLQILQIVFTDEAQGGITFTLCGYEVPGMILLRDLMGAMRLGRSKDMSVHVLTCNI